jgi:hypothetical protein
MEIEGAFLPASSREPSTSPARKGRGFCRGNGDHRPGASGQPPVEGVLAARLNLVLREEGQNATYTQVSNDDRRKGSDKTAFFGYLADTFLRQNAYGKMSMENWTW